MCRHNKYCVVVCRIISTLYLAIANLSFDNHLPEDGTCRSKHVRGVSCIYIYIYINYCLVTAGPNLCTNFAVLRARVLLMLVSDRTQCALCVHRTTIHSLLCSLKHVPSLRSFCVLMKPSVTSSIDDVFCRGPLARIELHLNLADRYLQY